LQLCKDKRNLGVKFSLQVAITWFLYVLDRRFGILRGGFFFLFFGMGSHFLLSNGAQKYATFQPIGVHEGATKMLQHSLCRLQKLRISGGTLMTPMVDLPHPPF
jgi:hypothetical protein